MEKAFFDLSKINEDQKKRVDLILFTDSNKWTVLEKDEKLPNSTSGTVGEFRKNLFKLKTLRKALKREEVSFIPKSCDKNGSSIKIEINDDFKPIEFTPNTKNILTLKRTIPMISELVTAATTTTATVNTAKDVTPSNPLIDQQVKVIQPTEWIDCISRESKRVFVKEHWIVARILLPPVSKDLVGLKRLTLE